MASSVKRKISPLLSESELSERVKILNYCASSREARRESCYRLREWYEAGSGDGEQATYNKMYSHINLISSFLFSPGSVRFGVHLPPAVRSTWIDKASIARDEFRQIWESCDADLCIADSLEWSLVYGSTIQKVQPHGTGFRISMVNQWDFGVSREDIGLEEQDAVAHWYTLSLSQIKRWVYGQPNDELIISMCEQYLQNTQSPPSQHRLVLSNISGTFPGGTISGGFPSAAPDDDMYSAQVDEPVVELVDLWERRVFKRGPKGDPFEDWLVTTMIHAPQIAIAQRRNPDLPNTVVSKNETLPAELPFSILSPRRVPDYIWGRTELRNLKKLQAWLTEYYGNIRDTVKRRLNPPKMLTGVANSDEASAVLDSAGGIYSAVEPNATMQPIVPPLSPETLQIGDVIQRLFSEQSGVPASMGDPGEMGGGVRATGHFSMAAGIGAAQVKRMAMVVENTLGEIATKSIHILQRNNDDALETNDGEKFLAGQIPSITLSVDGHSAAPIFSEQTQSKAMMLKQADAIGLENFVELVDPPNREELIYNAKKISKNKAEASKKMMEIQELKASKGLHKGK